MVDGSNFVTTDANTYTLTLAGNDATDLAALTTGQTVEASVDKSTIQNLASDFGL